MKLKIFLINTFFLLFIVVLRSEASISGPVRGSLCVVLDAGHGGKDAGACYQGIREKDINLATSLLVGGILEQKMPQLKVVYTRRDDRFVELSQRANIANQANANLFVSIHTNATKNATASGTETFVMGVDKAGANLSVAMRENGVISLEQDYTTKYEGYDPTSSESLIIFTLMQYSFERQSLQLASLIQANYRSKLPETKDRGVKQAGFLVLWRAAMPSVLTEIGFVSNPTEAALIISEKGQRKIAQSIADAIITYFGANIAIDENVDREIQTKPVPKTIERVVVTNKKSARKIAFTPALPADPQNEDSASQGRPVAAEADNVDDTVYHLQVMSSTRRVELNSANFGRYLGCTIERRIGNVYKYYVESRDSYKEILLLQSKVRETFHGAFCVAFKNGEQIALDQARRIKP